MMDQLHQWTRQWATDVTYLDFYKASSIRPLTDPHNILLSQWREMDLVHGELIGHQEDSGQWLSVMINTKDKRCPSGICIGTGVSIFINNINKGIECALSKFAWHQAEWCDWHSWRTGCPPEGPGQAWKWPMGISCSLKGPTCFTWIGETPSICLRLEDEQIESSSSEKNLGVSMGEWTWPNHVSLQPRKPNISRAASKVVWASPDMSSHTCIQVRDPQQKQGLHTRSRIYII